MQDGRTQCIESGRLGGGLAGAQAANSHDLAHRLRDRPICEQWPVLVAAQHIVERVIVCAPQFQATDSRPNILNKDLSCLAHLLPPFCTLTLWAARQLVPLPLTGSTR